MKIIFWISAWFITYTYILYPLLVYIISFFVKNQIAKGNKQPTISFLVISFNEIAHIKQKIENVLSLEYPQAKITYYFVSDNSNDGTDEVIKSYAPAGVRYIRYPERVGKAAIINDLVPKMQSEIVVFSDTRQTFNQEALLELIANFENEKVGAVSGELILINKNKAGFGGGIQLYWDYEKILRKLESKIDSTAGLTGCIYALKRALFQPIPGNTILDDFVIPMNVVKQGYRVVFEERAQAIDHVSETPKKEFSRKVRTLAGNFQAMAIIPFIINPLKNRIFFQFFSHKIFRLFIPYFLVFLLISSFYMNGISGRLFLYLQLAFYIMGILGFWINNKIFDKINSFIVLNTAAVVGLYNYLSQEQKGYWK